MLGSLRHLAAPLDGAGGTDDIAGYNRGTMNLTDAPCSWTVAVPAPRTTPGCLVDDSTRRTVKITLCHADYGHADLLCLVYLNLTETATGRGWFGNRQGWKSANDAADLAKRADQYADPYNNVQQIYCADVKQGDYMISVQYYKDKSMKAPTIPFGIAWLVF
ncbi:hypothetical protein Micbo1qcDRAFT_199290 [Microdochium bolleyi]|uniref:Uncharacterized protein n=1 Tax=Microdochium bolleyi TaxID=196109 RepID=A0A136JH58_9PEZI|nr:hypothetical protein Micbo1qcDRAFT_199290 [Microdochium bolleyi]